MRVSWILALGVLESELAFESCTGRSWYREAPPRTFRCTMVCLTGAKPPTRVERQAPASLAGSPSRMLFPSKAFTQPLDPFTKSAGVYAASGPIALNISPPSLDGQGAEAWTHMSLR